MRRENMVVAFTSIRTRHLDLRLTRGTEHVYALCIVHCCYSASLDEIQSVADYAIFDEQGLIFILTKRRIL